MPPLQDLTSFLQRVHHLLAVTNSLLEKATESELKSITYEQSTVLISWLERGTIINKSLSQKPDVAEAPCSCWAGSAEASTQPSELEVTAPPLCYGVSGMDTMALRNGVTQSWSIIHSSAILLIVLSIKHAGCAVFFPSKIQVIIFCQSQQTTIHILKVAFLQVSQSTIKQAYKWNNCLSEVAFSGSFLKILFS